MGECFDDGTIGVGNNPVYVYFDDGMETSRGSAGLYIAPDAEDSTIFNVKFSDLNTAIDTRYPNSVIIDNCEFHNVGYGHMD